MAAAEPQVTSLRLDLRRRVAAARLRPGRRPLPPLRADLVVRGSSATTSGRVIGSASAVLAGLRAGLIGSMPPGIAQGGTSDSTSRADSNASSICQPLPRDCGAVLGLPGWRGG
jgi:hypothetical protein